MTWKSIVAGVDDSPQGARAAAVAWNVARLTGAGCHLVHATRELIDFPEWVESHVDAEQLARNVIQGTHDRLEEALSGKVPIEALAQLEVRLGRPKRVIPEAIAEYEASLLVLGGKHHSALGKWLGGSTTLHCAQTVDIPTLITIPLEKDVERILVAVDRSQGVKSVVAAAKRLGTVFGAQVKLLHVIEPMPDIPSYPIDIESEHHFTRGKEHFEQFITSVVDDSAIEREAVFGPVERTIAQQVESWQADILVVGSHGRGWLERLLLGSTTRRLINDLPASLLVVPVPKPE